MTLSKPVKSQGKVREFCFPVYTYFEMHFFSEKTKSMLQSKQSDQFDTLPLTHEVVVVSGFRENAFFQIPSSSFHFSRKEGENEEKNIDGLQKKLK